MLRTRVHCPQSTHSAMFHPCVLLRTLAPVLVLGLLLGGCIMSAAEDEAPVHIEPAVAERMAELSEAAFPEATAAEPAPKPTPETVAPTPESETAVSEHVVATVTGSLVNLRVGPGTDHPTAGHVHAGDQVRITGRNADGSWLQLLHPVAVGKLVWIFGPLTDINDTTVQTLAEVTAVAVELEVEAQPAVTVPTSEPVAQPEPEAPSVAAPTVPADCVRHHTVNSNETRLQQITDWLGLDLAATAALNGIAPDAPLTAGTELCLPADLPDPEMPILSAVAAVSPSPTLSAGHFHNCALRTDGTAYCWGYNEFGQATSPSGTFIAVSAGHWHTCALQTDGSVVCWGDDRLDQNNSRPSGTFVALDSGTWHTCALSPAGTIACWGQERYGLSTAPSGHFAAVSAGHKHTCALQTDGASVCWGDNEFGQATPPAERLVAISAGGFHTCALRTDGSVVCWGDDTLGQKDPLPRGTFTALSAGYLHTCSLQTDGTPVCWGDNESGQATPPAGPFVALDSGAWHTCALRPDDTIVCWGDNEFVAQKP